MAVTVHQIECDAFDIEGPLGHEDRCGPASDTCPRGQVAGVAAHDLKHHEPVVGCRGRVQAINRVGGHVERGIEPDADIGSPDIVVDRLRNRHHGESCVVNHLASHHGAVSADRDESLHSVSIEAFDQRLRTIFSKSGMASRSA